MTLESGIVAVTGATGFIGAHLCDALVAHGGTTRAVVRVAAPAIPGVEQVVAPLTDTPALTRALAGAHTLIHLAGRAHVLREPPGGPSVAFRDVNVEGTRRLLEAAAGAGVARVIVLSSIGAVATTAHHRIGDDTPPAPDTPYGRSKLEAESVVRSSCERAGMGYLILRPPMVYGPRMKGNPLRLFRLVDRGVPLPLGAVRNQRSTMYVDNLVAAILRGLALPDATRDTFVVGDSAPRSSAELVREIAHALGAPVRLIGIPPAVMRGAGRVGDLLGRIIPFPLTSSAVDRLYGSLAVDHSRFSEVTGFSPPVARNDAMAITAAWFRGAR